MKNQIKFYLNLGVFAILVSSCISDDFIDDMIEPRIRILSNIEQIPVGETVQLQAEYLNNVGILESVGINWTSSNEDILIVSETGELTALELGESIITAEYDNGDFVATDSILVKTGSANIIESSSFSGTNQDNIVLCVDR